MLLLSLLIASVASTTSPIRQSQSVKQDAVDLVIMQLQGHFKFDLNLFMKEHFELKNIIKLAGNTFDYSVVEKDFKAVIDFELNANPQRIEIINRLILIRDYLKPICDSNKDLLNGLRSFEGVVGSPSNAITVEALENHFKDGKIPETNIEKQTKSNEVMANWEEFKWVLENRLRTDIPENEKLRFGYIRFSELPELPGHKPPVVHSTAATNNAVYGKEYEGRKPFNKPTTTQPTLKNIQPHSDSLPMHTKATTSSLPHNLPTRAVHPVHGSPLHPQAVHLPSQVHSPQPHSSPSAIQLRQQSTRSASNRLYMAVSALVLLMGGIGSYIYYHPDLIQTSTVHNFASTPFNK